jgi:glycerophosphoryl diester phosphodiesterase
VCTKSLALGKKNIADFDLQEMKDWCKLYNGQVILTLQEVLEKTSSQVKRHFVDVKVHTPEQRQYVAPMLESIAALWLADHVMFSSADDEANMLITQTENILAWREIYDPLWLSEALNSSAAFILIPWDIAQEDLIQTIIEAKKMPIVFTVNTATKIKTLYERWVRFVLTDNRR